MCYSAGVSFTSAVILLPAGLLCLKNAVRLNMSYWPFALLPFAFGLQQAFEGGVWWSIENNNAEILRLSALGFVFFSHFFWLAWIPFSCYFTETIQTRRTLFLLIASVGAVSGASMFLPFLLHSNWLTVSVAHHSIIYQTTFIYDNYLPQFIGMAIYILFIMLPLMLSSNQHVRILGILIFISMIVSLTFYSFAFTSIWCYFAAVISLYIYYIMTIKLKPVVYPA